jgi:hypothetical protein
MDSPTVQAPAVPAIAEEAGLVRNDQATADFIARANAVFVTIDDMFLASAEIHKLPSEDRNWEGRMNCLTQIFRGRRDKAFVVNARLEAMARLVSAGKLPYGVLPTGVDGLNLIADPVFMAAAKVPILFIDKESYFEPEPFAVFVLENAKACGHA